MKCCSSKKPVDKDKNPQPSKNTTDYNRINTEQRKQNIKVRPEEVWDQISPINPPYPPDTVDLDAIIQHNQIANDSIEQPENELFTKKVEGYWVDGKWGLIYWVDSRAYILSFNWPREATRSPSLSFFSPRHARNWEILICSFVSILLVLLVRLFFSFFRTSPITRLKVQSWHRPFSSGVPWERVDFLRSRIPKSLSKDYGVSSFSPPLKSLN